MKNQLQDWRETLAAGKAWLMAATHEKPSIRAALPACATSETADVWLFGAWAAYHGIGEIDYIHKTRGNAWKIKTTRGFTMQVNVRDPYDHRTGVVEEYVAS